MRLVSQLTSFYVNTKELQPTVLIDGYNWLLKHGLDPKIRHRGIKKSFCVGVTTFISKSITSTSISKTTTTTTITSPKSEEKDFFIADADVNVSSMQSPQIMAACNDLLLVLLERITRIEKGSTRDSGIHPEELNVLVRACIAHKASQPRKAACALLMKLWTHPNSNVRHTSLKGYLYLMKAKLPEIIELLENGSTNRPSKLVVRINQRLADKNCDDEDRELLNLLLSWFYKH